MKQARSILWALLAASALLTTACGPSNAKASGDQTGKIKSSESSQATSTTTPIPVTATPQPTATAVDYGPDPEDFPSGINPLTGQAVSDPSLLDIPAMLVSISHFPPTARPQAGLSFAPYVFEFSITEGQSRFLAIYYGGFPTPETPMVGDCAVRGEPFVQSNTLLGNRVWLDTNQNGIQDFDEKGIGGICVNLYDADGKLLQKTTTDSNGYYGFNVDPDGSYVIKFVKPDGLDFTRQNVGDENHDSDADPSTGRTPVIDANIDDLTWDAGLVPSENFVTPTPDPKTAPKAEVGPVRSGRLLYAYIAGFFQDSCLVDAFASPEVLVKIPHCSFVTHEDSGGGSMLTIDRMIAIAGDNMRHTADKPFNYTSNVFSGQVPSGGLPGTQINMFYALLNQSGWTYDPLYGAYLRFVDLADKNNPGVLHPDVDRLTNRQLHFENVIVLMADTDVVSPTNIDIHLDQGDSGYAYLFRDGEMFPIRWSTKSGEYEKKTGFRRPIQFVNQDGTPAALKPGHTWVIIVTPFSTFEDQGAGRYFVRYAAPEGEAR